VGVRLETRNAGTERLGLGLEVTTFDATWRSETLAAFASNPSRGRLYERRSTIAPSVTFAITPYARFTAGVSITELEPRDESQLSQSANAYVVSLGYDRRWTTDRVRHGLDASVGVRAGSESLHSDAVYQRYVANVSYQVRWRHHNELLASGMAGGVTNRAPLFERFTLGDSSTLRGWNKYDIAPIGGDRMAHSSVEYRHRGLAFFLDGGSIWDAGTDSQARFSTGFGYHQQNVFITVGFPLNTDDVRAVFTAGVRF
jgi:outer membrane protein assembly factor BamA